MIIVNSALQSMVDHLEFLGYQEAEYIDEEKKTLILVKHKIKNNLVFEAKLDAEIAYVYSILSLTKDNIKKVMNDKERFFSLLNHVNVKSNISTFSFNEESEWISISTWKELHYNKEHFSNFINLLETDHQNFLEMSDFFSK